MARQITHNRFNFFVLCWETLDPFFLSAIQGPKNGPVGSNLHKQASKALEMMKNELKM